MPPLTLFADLAFRGTFPLWLAGLLAIATVPAVVYVYFRESLKMHPIQRFVLAGLRTLAVWLLLFLICKPVLVDDFKGDKARPIAVLFDNSQSMLQTDPRLTTEDRIRLAIARGERDPKEGLLPPISDSQLPTDSPSRLEVVKAAFSNPKLQLPENIGKVGPFQPYHFGSRLRGVSDSPEKPWLTTLSGDEKSTAMFDSLTELFQKDENEYPSGIVLVTDGRDNTSITPPDDLIRELNRLKIPLHIYGVGGSPQGFLRLRDVIVQDTLFVEDTVTVPVRWRCEGIKQGEVELQLNLNGKPVGKPKRVAVREGYDLSETLSFTPTKADGEIQGRQELSASIRLISGGQPLQDEVKKSVRVVNRKVRVLVIEREPRWEFKFLQRTFQRDRRTEPSYLITQGDREMMKSKPFIPAFPGSRKELFDNYDLLILGDIDAAFFTPQQQEWIRDFVSEGGGLVVIAGRLFGPSTWVNTPLAQILPVRIAAVKFAADSGGRPNEFIPKLTEVGERSAMMSLADTPAENARIWQSLPGWYWNYPVAKLAPAAVSLLDHPKLKMEDGKPMPLMAMHYQGSGLVLFCASEETWRWRWNDSNEADKYFSRFWGQVIYQVGLPHTLGSRSSRMALEQPEMVLGKPGRVFARLFTPNYIPQEAPKFTGRLERLDAPPGEPAQTVTLERDPEQKGEYRLTLPNDREGRYLLTVDTGGETARLEYRVSLPPDHELAKAGMNDELLKNLAEQTDGKFYREEDLEKLPSNLTTKMVSFTRRQEKLLWTWEMLLMFVGLLTLEWIVRKFSNLS